LFCGIRQRSIAVKLPNGSVCIQQIAAHLHAIPEIFKRRVKVVSHLKQPFRAAKHATALRFRY
jgi:hypothetical protein